MPIHAACDPLTASGQAVPHAACDSLTASGQAVPHAASVILSC